MTAVQDGGLATRVVTAGERANHERRRATVVAVTAPLLFFVVLGVLWQWTAFARPSLLPPLDHVVLDWVTRPAWYLDQLWATLQNVLLGLFIGVVIAFGLAVGMVFVRPLGAAVMPFALLLVSTPIVAISPALIVAFGFTSTPRIITVVICVFFPMLVNSSRGLREIDPQAEEVFRTLSAGRLDLLLRLRLPSSLPFLFTGLRLSASSAMMGGIISEFTAVPLKGLGASIVLSSTTYLNLAQLWGSIFVSAIVTIALIGVVALVERALVRW